jgi:glucosyl-dolichyl phosphate glucuronosyltransferase
MISVIIPTHNRAGLLGITLTSLTRQTVSCQDFEVIVVDNGSTDNTKEVVNSFCSSLLPNLRYVQEPIPGLHAGRHCGLRESKGSVLTFADDDIEAYPTWLEGIRESFSDEQVALVGGKCEPHYESQLPEWIENLWINVEEGRYLVYFSLLDFGNTTKAIEPYYVFGCNFSIRKDVLLKVKGFHPDGMPQDLLKYRGDGETFVAEQVQKLGLKTIYNPKASVKHWVPSSRMNINYLKKRAFAEGITQSYRDTRKQMLDGTKSKRVHGIIKRITNQIRMLRLNNVKQEIEKSFNEGYKFHQSQLKVDKDLLSWVVKDNYL